MWEAIFFYGFALVAVVSALLMVLMKNPIISAVYLVVTFFSIAAFFVMLSAPLLAALQVLVYAGAIMVLFLFVIMLLNLNRTSFTSYKLFFTKLIALVVVAVILLVIAGSLGEVPATQAAPLAGDDAYQLSPSDENHVMSLGMVLFSRYIYPFEIMAIMLLAGIIGAVLLTKKRV
jgi:NADH-quinone oxidoreductase subunit J